MKDFHKAMVVFFIAIIMGCTSTQTTAPGSPGENVPPVPNTPIFYDFPDVPVPPELQIVRKDSSVFQTTSFKTGVLVFKGRVDYVSVLDFYLSAMPQQNWKLRGSSRYGRSILVFEKSERICVINIEPETWYTYVEIYVIPSQL